MVIKNMSSFDLFSEYGVENCKIELIEYFPCDTLQELRRKEGEHIKNTECINKRVAGRTDKEYKEDNKERKKVTDREYYEINKDRINEKKREYYQNNKNKIKEYREQNKNKIKEMNEPMLR